MDQHTENIKDTVPYMLGRIDGKIDQVLANQATHNERITALELSEKSNIRDKGFAAGVAAIIGAGFSWLLTKMS